MSAQSGIPKHKLSRAAVLAGTGAKIGGNYVKYYAGKAVGRPNREALNEANAKETYRSFSTLKGGPLKVAQMLSIDQNFLPRAYRDQFAQSYYSTPPLSVPLVVRTFSRTLGKHPDEIFDSFTREAVAAASIGQVHRATIGDKTYAVKIQYPGVAGSLKSDLGILRPFARHVLNMNPTALDRYMTEAEARLLEECDYGLELRRSVALSESSAHLQHIHFPRYYPEYSSSHVITMDWMEGLPIDQWLKTNPDEEARDRIGQAMWDFLHFQVHGLKEFHADPHPGNFLVRDGALVVLDFGCVKKLDDDFYQAYFKLLEPGLLDRPDDLETCLG
ncbi:MAG: AarF/ABC1/UbiB kinase family protein, partial [Verrucomicrobiota bacterium]